MFWNTDFWRVFMIIIETLVYLIPKSLIVLHDNESAIAYVLMLKFLHVRKNSFVST